MKRYLILFMIVFLQACATQHLGPLISESSSSDYNPLTTDNVDAKRYQADKQQCYKQVQDQSELKMSDRYNVIKFRECLVQKGYVLMS